MTFHGIEKQASNACLNLSYLLSFLPFAGDLVVGEV